jgi:glucokinase
MQIVAGDIGGTNTRIALYRADSPVNLVKIRERVYPSEEHDGLESILRHFLEHSAEERIPRACFGIAGPVIDQVCEATNLPWRVSAAEIKESFDFDAVYLLNDLEANAWGIEVLPEKDLFELSPGRGKINGNRCIISAGTGLGEAGLYWDGREYQPFPSEGGHTDFSPRTDLEFKLFEWLAAQFGHVSWERLVSGPGLENIYRFLLQHQGEPEPDWLEHRSDDDDFAPAISDAALTGSDPVASEALDLFITLYAREAGNQALKLMATGGVFLGGGIAPKLLPRIKQGDFLAAFHDKGRMQPLMESMPVHIILNEMTALMGAARYAAIDK